MKGVLYIDFEFASLSVVTGEPEAPIHKIVMHYYVRGASVERTRVIAHNWSIVQIV